MQRYVVGFALAFNEVLLIHKTHPEWQAGRWNGIGGKVEPGESPLAAMRREAHEEANVDDDAEWEHFATLTDPQHGAYEVHFFRLDLSGHGNDYVRHRIRTTGEEGVEWWPCALTGNPALCPVIPNLRWLIPMARFDFPKGGERPFVIANRAWSPEEARA